MKGHFPLRTLFMSLITRGRARLSKLPRQSGVGTCYCRHKMEHAGTRCDAPMDICMTFNASASSLVRSGYARGIDASECLDLLDLAQEHNLVQFGENVQQNVNFICNCCSCCCEALVAARKYGMMHPVHTTNFLPGSGYFFLYRLRQVRKRLPC